MGDRNFLEVQDLRNLCFANFSSLENGYDEVRRTRLRGKIDKNLSPPRRKLTMSKVKLSPLFRNLELEGSRESFFTFLNFRSIMKFVNYKLRSDTIKRWRSRKAEETESP